MSCSKDASFKITFFCLFYLHLFDKAYIAQSTVTGELIFADRITAAGAFLVGFFFIYNQVNRAAGQAVCVRQSACYVSGSVSALTTEFVVLATDDDRTTGVSRMSCSDSPTN